MHNILFIQKTSHPLTFTPRNLPKLPPNKSNSQIHATYTSPTHNPNHLTPYYPISAIAPVSAASPLRAFRNVNNGRKYASGVGRGMKTEVQKES